MNTIPFVDLKRQYLSIKHKIDDAIKNVISKTDFINGDFVRKFENNFARKLGLHHCIGVGNGTDGLSITLKALNIGKGDEVITVANSFVATAEAISNSGAKVVFTDCDEKSHNIDISKIEEKINRKTKAIIPVHLYGNPSNISEIIKIAKKYKLFVIEDCAQSHFALHRNKFTGTYGIAGVFSFYPGKNLGAYGDGGAIVTNNNTLAQRIRMIANHGRIEKYNHKIIGQNSRLDGLQAAVLNVKLNYIDEWNIKRRKLSHYYINKLQNLTDIDFININKYDVPVYHLFVIRTKYRDDLQYFLNRFSIQTQVHYPISLPFLKAYSFLKHQRKDFPVSSKLEKQILSLPLFPELDIKEIDYITEKINEFFSRINR